MFDNLKKSKHENREQHRIWQHFKTIKSERTNEAADPSFQYDLTFPLFLCLVRLRKSFSKI